MTIVSFTSLSLASRLPRRAFLSWAYTFPVPTPGSCQMCAIDLLVTFRSRRPTMFLIKGVEDEANVQSSQGLDLGPLLTLSAGLH